MKEQDYINTTDIQLLRSVKRTLELVNAFNHPNKIRLMKLNRNIDLMILDLMPKIEITDEA